MATANSREITDRTARSDRHGSRFSIVDVAVRDEFDSSARNELLIKQQWREQMQRVAFRIVMDGAGYVEYHGGASVGVIGRPGWQPAMVWVPRSREGRPRLSHVGGQSQRSLRISGVVGTKLRIVQHERDVAAMERADLAAERRRPPSREIHIDGGRLRTLALGLQNCGPTRGCCGDCGPTCRLRRLLSRANSDHVKADAAVETANRTRYPCSHRHVRQLSRRICRK
jgi:hypothetical protein